MMGYDEPASKRPAVAVAPAKRRWPFRLGLLAVALLGGAYFATRANPDDPMAAITAFASDPMKAIDSLFPASAGAGRGNRPNAAPPVRVAAAESRDVPVTVHTIGTVLANSVVNIKSQVDGPLLSAHFKEGQMVKEGDLLFDIDPAPFEAMLRQSQAQKARDEAQHASAQADADRAVMLAERGIVATQQRDQLVATEKALAATIEADQAAIDRAQLNLGYTKIYSPITGKTGPFIVYPGNQVHANDAAGLITITQIQPVKITFNLPQGELPQLQARLAESQLVADVSARSDVAEAGTPLADRNNMDIPVKVDFIGNTVDARTGTIELRATFLNPDQRLVPGELVDVSVKLETLKQVAVVPREAVNVGQGGDYVFVLDKDKKAQMRPVKVLFQDQSIAALGSGVEPNETVITDGQLRVAPGSAVSIMGEPNSNAKSPAAQADTPQGTRSEASSGQGAPG
jgi:multidrug efflux system membrane fusion protein